VIPFTLEDTMRSDPDHAVAISRWSAIGAGFTLATQPDGHAIVDSRGNRNLQFDLLPGITSAAAVRTWIGNHLSCALATRASGLHAKNASRLHHLTTTAAASASFRGRPRFCSACTARAAGFTAVECDRLTGASSRLLQFERDTALDVRPTTLTPTTASAKTTTEQTTQAKQIAKRFKNVANVREMRCGAARFQPSMTILVIYGSFVVVVQYFVRLGSFLELLRGVFVVSVAVRMVAYG